MLRVAIQILINFSQNVIAPWTAHRIVGYAREKAVCSYTEYLAGVEHGTYPNVPAPQVAIDYWKLVPGTLLRDVIAVIRAVEVRQSLTGADAKALRIHLVINYLNTFFVKCFLTMCLSTER